MILKDGKFITTYDVVIGLNNVADYSEFLAVCDELQFPVLNPIDFAMTVGMVVTAQQRRPDLAPIEAVSDLIANNLQFIKSVKFSNQPQIITSTEGCCGGGEIR